MCDSIINFFFFSLQQDSLVFPPGKSRPLPSCGNAYHQYSYPPTEGAYPQYSYPPTEGSYMEPGYSDPYMERRGSGSVVDINYTEAMHTPHPNTPNPLNPPPLQYSQHNSNNPQHNLTPNLPRHQLFQQPQYQNNNINKHQYSNNESSSNSKRSDSRTTTSITNSPRDRSNNLSSRTTTSDQYYNSVSSSCGGDDYSSPMLYNNSNYHHNNSSNNHHHNNKISANNRCSEHSYARLTPSTGSPAPPPYGITLPPGANNQSQYVVHYNL